jgi:outer membrane biosynthesis protein TonB
MKTRIKLEPLGRLTTLVITAHIIAGLGIWWWLEQEIEVAASPATASGLVWMSPSDFKAPAAAVSEAISSEPIAADITQQTKPAPDTQANATPSVVAPTPAVPAPRAIAIPSNATPEDIARILAVMQARAPTLPVKPAVVAAAAITTSDNAVAKPMPSVAAMPPPATPKAESPAPKSEPKTPQSSQPTEVSRVITVQHLEPASSPAPSAPPAGASLADIAAYEASGTGSKGASRGVNMDDVDRAIMRAFTQNWVVRKEFANLPPEQRDAHMDIAVGREGQVLRFVMAKSSGNKTFDDSVLAAGNLVENIQSKLPATYTGERYEIQVNFHAE